MAEKKLFIFDLDFTLWDADGIWCDCTTPPYQRVNGYVADAIGHKIKLYPDVLEIIASLKAENKLIAIASRTEEPEWAKQILELFEIRNKFDFEEIFPDRKSTHLSSIKKQSNISFNDMVFFDDEYRNIEDVSELGVTSVWTKNGLNKEIVYKYL
jgi:magnesium-dependent phosphatase 1